MSDQNRIQPWIQQFLGSNVTPLYVLRSKTTYKLPKEMTWGEISEWIEVEVELLHDLNPKLARINTKLKLGTIIIVPGKALNVSYSVEGLKWTASKTRLHYFKNPVRLKTVSYESDEQLKLKVVMEGDTSTISPNVFVEQFIPRNHIRGGRIDRDSQVSEFLWVDKALRLHYVPYADQPKELDLLPEDEVIFDN